MAIAIESPEFIDFEVESLRKTIQASISDPIEEELIRGSLLSVDYDSDYAQGVFLGDQAVLIDITSSRAKRFFDMIREEMDKARLRGVRFAKELNEGYEGENPFDHELAHVKEAERHGVNLRESYLSAVFTDGCYANNYAGIGLIISFRIPSDLKREVKRAIRLAPSKPSFVDLVAV